jgi:DMSO/TMAO reductase YedYZ molybdopterin-dependent catalytic subunit
MRRPRPPIRRPQLPPLPGPPPGPFRPGFWRSPLRGPWLTSILGSVLFGLVALVALTGWISHGAYQPQIAANYTFPRSGDALPLIHLPASSPAWIYALTQGIHITVGLVAIPVLLAKLWSVIPRLYAWPPVKNAAQALERLSLLLLVGGALFEFATGVLDIQLFYPWHFSFTRSHYYGGWVFISALLLHVAVKLPTVRGAYRTRGVLKPLRENLAATEPEPYVPGGLAPQSPAAPSLSRRGLLGLVGGGSLALLIANLGESVGGPVRDLALLAPRGRTFGSGPNDFQVNKTAHAVGVTAMASDPNYRLTVKGGRTVSLSRAQLLAMDQQTYEMPIACVEGWSTSQHWSGVRLADLGTLVGATPEMIVQAHSLQTEGPFRAAAFTTAQVNDDRALLALRVNGADLSLDHGYPARIIIPGVPGVHCTKWVASLTFEAA